VSPLEPYNQSTNISLAQRPFGLGGYPNLTSPYITYEKIFYNNQNRSIEPQFGQEDIVSMLISTVSETALSVTVGDGQTYGPYLNGPLSPGTEYYFRLLVYTGPFLQLVTPSNSSCVDTNIAKISTLPTPPSASAAGGGLGLAAAGGGGGLVIGVCVFLWLKKKKRDKLASDGYQTETKITAASRDAIERQSSSDGGPAIILPNRTKSISVKQPVDTSRRQSDASGAISIARPSQRDSGNIQIKPRSIPAAVQIMVCKTAVLAYEQMGLVLAPPKTHSVSIEDLPGVMAQLGANTNAGYTDEYEAIESGDEYPRTAAKDPLQKPNNRYANILPYDHSRVTVSRENNDPLTEYINANYIDGYGNKPRSYIAAQGPKDITLIAFWKMLWENKVPIIIMVTNCEEKGRPKCVRYWPEKIRQEMYVGKICLTLTSEEEFAEYLIRTITVQNGSEMRIMRQFHFIAWPDHGVPETTLTTINILRKARLYRQRANGPMVIHCSAGVGRTGTLLAIDVNMDYFAKHNAIDVVGVMNHMRRQRSTMVQTEDQFVFIYQALADCCQAEASDLDPQQLRAHFGALHTPHPEPGAGTYLQYEFNKIANIPISVAFRTDEASKACNKSKLRYNLFKPYDHTRVVLNGVPGEEGSDFINASFIDSYERKKSFIATQGPLDSTIEAFWEMVWQKQCNSIVMLTNLREDNHGKCDQYWPDPDESPLTIGCFEIHLREEVTAHKWLLVRVFTLTEALGNKRTSRQVKQFCFLDWPSKGCPTSGATIVELSKMVEAHTKSEGNKAKDEENIYGNQFAISDQALRPIVVHCAGGIDRSGVFIAVTICLQRLYEENHADLFSVVKHMRTERGGMIATPDQYAFAYRCICDYLDSLEESIYGNVESDGVTSRHGTIAQPSVRRSGPTTRVNSAGIPDTPVAKMAPPTRAPPTLPYGVTAAESLSRSLEVVKSGDSSDDAPGFTVQKTLSSKPLPPSASKPAVTAPPKALKYVAPPADTSDDVFGFEGAAMHMSSIPTVPVPSAGPEKKKPTPPVRGVALSKPVMAETSFTEHARPKYASATPEYASATPEDGSAVVRRSGSISNQELSAFFGLNVMAGMGDEF